jgi:hypothetical protein
MLKIVSMDNGRIFMCGKDGNLYELVYQGDLLAMYRDLMCCR